MAGTVNKRVAYLVRYHLHAMLFFYVWLGLFVCGLVAPDERVAGLGSSVVTRGWHLSLLSVLLVLPWPVLYAIRFRKTHKEMKGDADGV
ncbi:MAG: hypothetical protein WC889_16305 [Myxococcota bacterium]|jgi:hypothetical protein